VAQNASGGNANGGNVVLTPGTGNGSGSNGSAEVTTLSSTATGVAGNKPVYADNNGDLNALTPPYFTHVHTITTSSSYTVPAGATRIKVYLVGGGGGSDNASFEYNIANESDPPNYILTHLDVTGGSGGYISGELETTPGESLSITIGAGGSGSSSLTGVCGGGGGTYIERGATLLCGAGGGGGASGYNTLFPYWFNHWTMHIDDSNYIGLAGGQSFGNTVASLAGPAGLTAGAYGAPSCSYTGYLEYAKAFTGTGATINTQANATATEYYNYDDERLFFTIGAMPQSHTGIGSNTSYGLPDNWSFFTGLSGVVIVYY